MRKLGLVVLALLVFSNILLSEEQMKLVIVRVVEDSEAEKAGLVPGDVLLSYGGTPVYSISGLQEIMQQTTSDSVSLLIYRTGEELTFKIPGGKMGVNIAERAPEVKLKPDAVIIRGIERLGWDLGMSNSFHASLLRVLNYKGVGVDYTYLMGVSGAAFRIHFHKDWCPSSPDPTCGFDCGTKAIEAMGFDFAFHGLEESKENKPEVQEAIKQSIDNEMPVIAIDLIEVPEWGVITGYQDEAKAYLCRTYYDNVDGYNLAQKFPWTILVLGEETGAPTEIENYKNSLRLAEELLGTEMYGDYYSGTAALKYWIDALGKVQVDNLDEQKFEEVCLANAWIYSRLIEDREYAMKYLDRLIPKFPEISSSLVELSELYRIEVEALKEEENITPFPWMLKKPQDWTLEMREKQLELLNKALVQEEKAAELLNQIIEKL